MSGKHLRTLFRSHPLSPPVVELVDFACLLTPCSTVLLEKLTGFAANQEIPRILWNPKVYYRTHKRPPPVPILSQLHPFSYCMMPSLETLPPGDPSGGECFTSGLFCLQRKHLTYEYFITEFFSPRTGRSC